ncbi:MAG: efflux RND transporter periplasmic adaptor subunit [Desulfobacteraceae bacterium]|nr:efflux RND transporter periplasmic adaptor subunit [Desulfobacteraceae bacterium]
MKNTKALIKRWGLFVFLTAIIVFAAYVIFLKPIDVKAARVTIGTVTRFVRGPGLVEARIPVEVSTKITGVITSLMVDQGNKVKKGQLIATLDDADSLAKVSSGKKAVAVAQCDLETARADLEKARADLTLARNNYQRDHEVFMAGYISPAAMDATEAALQAAQSSTKAAETVVSSRIFAEKKARDDLRYAEAMLSYTKIYAPMDGIIIQRDKEVGATVSPGVSIFSMVDPNTVWVMARIDETVVGKVHINQPALIRLRSGGEFKGYVARIERQSNAVTRELEVDVAFDNIPKRFAIDQEGDVTILTGTAKGLVIPAAALVGNKNGEQGVMMVKNGRARFQPVETGATDGVKTIVTTGLKEDDIVVIGPAVTDGRPVRIKNQGSGA